MLRSFTTSQDGGAIFYSCLPPLPCNVTLEGNMFFNNTAASKGGAILWVNRNFTEDVHNGRRQLDDSCASTDFADHCHHDGNQFANNSAKYGRNIGSFVSRFDLHFDDPDNTGVEIDNLSIKLSPGQPFNLFVALYD